MADNPNTIPQWDALWAKTGYRFPEQKPVNERKRAVASFLTAPLFSMSLAGPGKSLKFSISLLPTSASIFPAML